MQRMRRLRVNENMRSLVRETSVEISDLVYPIFVEEGENIAEPIPSMPGIITSNTITSGINSFAKAIASIPDLAVLVTKPSLVSE